jgi:hypothetical protein
MITVNEINEAIDRLIPDETAINDARSILHEDQEKKHELFYPIEFEDNVMMVPKDAHIEVIGKKYKHWRKSFPYGANTFRVIVSLGKPEVPTDDFFHDSEYCFMTLLYDENGERIDDVFFDEFL